MISKDYLYHIVRVKDSSSDTPILKSLWVVSEFQEVFPQDLPGVHPERKIDFGIKLLPDTHPSSIPPCTMVQAMIKELKHLLNRVLIRPSISL